MTLCYVPVMTFSALQHSPSAAAIDQRVWLHGVSWADYEALLALRGESAGVRLTYLEGELELMTPSHSHEGIKTALARLIEAWAEEQGIELEGYGSWTVRSAPQARGVEADECYLLGRPPGEPKRPDIAIEVIWTAGGLDKLEVYRGLEVPEVWMWQDGTLRFHLLRHGAYREAPRSALLPDLDPALLLRCLQEPSQTRAVRALRQALRG
jgi:Uma2 family endonuclease